MLKNGCRCARPCADRGVATGKRTEIVKARSRKGRASSSTARPPNGEADALCTEPIDQPLTLIEFTAVTKVYGSGDAAVHALAGVDLKIQAQEFVAIMGPSGSGKSTAMNIIGCLDTPTSGSYFFKGIDVGRLGRDQRALLAPAFPRLRISGLQSAFPHVAPSRTSSCPWSIAACRSRSGASWRRRALDRVGPQRPRAPHGQSAVGRPAAARRHCTRDRHQPRRPARRRADRQPRYQDQPGDHGSAHQPQPRPGHHGGHGHARGRHCSLRAARHPLSSTAALPPT